VAGLETPDGLSALAIQSGSGTGVNVFLSVITDLVADVLDDLTFAL